MSVLTSQVLPPKVLDYSDYHHFIRDFYKFKKHQNRRFSFRKFSELSGIKSSNYLMLVMSSRRKLLPETARAVARAMRLSPGEIQYFISLVKLERTHSPDERLLIEMEQKSAIKKILGREVPSDKSEYLSVWYYSLVRELAFLPDFQAEPGWISKKLGGMIDILQAEAAIKILVNLGFWKKSGRKIEVQDVFLDTGDDARIYSDISVTNIHKNNMIAWTKILDVIPQSEREMGLLNIPIKSSRVPELKARIQKFQEEIIGWLHDEQAPDQLVQLGTYLVPVTKVHRQKVE